MTDLVVTLLVFLSTGIGFLLVNLFVGKLVRPSEPNTEKGMVYECGEPTIGSSWIQFDLRFYVVALLFAIFDVEMAFFFPWATVFGSANKLGDPDTPIEARAGIESALTGQQIPLTDAGAVPSASELAAWKSLAQLAFIDILVFFSVLLVGFAYLWKRGDLEWVRSMAGQESTPPPSSGVS